ncbi:hypothetical protein EON77_12535, partial [bacterium]
GDEVTYALEGSAFIAGAAVQWLRDGLGIVRHASEIEALARKVETSDGVVFVPALAGLGAPYWDPDARGTICGLTRGSTAAHLARATLEGIAFQVNDLLAAMAKDAGRAPKRLRVDGGAAANDLLMQMQADIAGVVVERPVDIESTGRGAAMLAAVGAGLAPGADAQASSGAASASRMLRLSAAPPSRRSSAEVRARAITDDAPSRRAIAVGRERRETSTGTLPSTGSTCDVRSLGTFKLRACGDVALSPGAPSPGTSHPDREAHALAPRRVR